MCRRYIPPKRVFEQNEGGSFADGAKGAIPRTRNGHTLIGKNHNKGPYYDPKTGIYSYTAPYQTLKNNPGKVIPEKSKE